LKLSRKHNDEETKPTPAAPAPRDTVSEAFALLQQLQPLREAAIEELLAQRAKIDDQLAQLGYEPAAATAVSRSPRRRSVADPTKPCPVCGKLGHDRRFHRYEHGRSSPELPPPEPSQ
jgi:hypothetical protein